jgi:NhaP-type Na+/H+ or K+/H+ antiporter
LAVFVVVFAAFAKWLSSSVVTAPIVFLGLGFAFAHNDLLAHVPAEEALHLVAEVALILLLFTDAAQIRLDLLLAKHVWPARMLLIGLPLSIVFGAAAAWLILPGLPVVAALLVASVLAPTDAALGQAVVTNPDVPDRSRRALVIESGLNDGMALPAVLLFAGLTVNATDTDGFGWLLFASAQLVLGPLVGLFVGTVGGRLFVSANERDLTSVQYEGLGAIALAAAAYLGAEEVGGNGFIAAFVAGLSFGNVVGGGCRFVYEFAESEGQLLTWSAFFLLGVVLLPEALEHLSVPVLLTILTSLFFARPFAIWISLLGTDSAFSTRLFFGWFGPRGLATALFALIVVREICGEFGHEVLLLAVNAVWISALLHGVTAVPGARLYAQSVEALGDCAESRRPEA